MLDHTPSPPKSAPHDADRTKDTTLVGGARTGTGAPSRRSRGRPARLLLTGGAEVAGAAEVADLRDGRPARGTGTPGRLGVHETRVPAGPAEEVALVAPAAGGDHVLHRPRDRREEVVQLPLTQRPRGSGAGGDERGT